MEKLHGFETGVTKVMVETWNKGKVKIDGVSHKITKGLIAKVAKIPQDDISFFNNKKMSANIVSRFVKDEAERNNIIKVDTYYEMDSIKKLWRYVLRILIEYFTLDSRFDRIRTHHFVLLNHFRHVVKISFPFFLFTSMSKSIEGFNKKPITNPSLHNGLLLLVYEFLNAQTRGKSLDDPANALEDMASSDSKDVQIVKSEDGDYSSKVFSSSSNPHFPSRKSPRGLPPFIPKPKPQEEKEDTEEEEETETESEDEDKAKGKDIVKDDKKERETNKEDVALEASLDNPRKIKVDQALLQEDPITLTSETPSPNFPSPLPKEKTMEKSGEVIRKDRIRAWRNFNMDTVSLGIVREPMNIQVMEDLDGKTHYDESIDPTLLLLSNNTRESGFNLLNNAKSGLIDNFRSIKWLFQENKALKGKNI
jgi:hypothetical protein